MKLTNAQANTLRAVADGLVHRKADMGWFQKGGYRLRGGRAPSPATVDKLADLGLVDRGRMGRGEVSCAVTITAKGKEVLASWQ